MCVEGATAPRLPLAVPEVDGWSEWQLWDLMATFSPFCGNGLPLVFETEIELPDPVGDGRK